MPRLRAELRNAIKGRTLIVVAAVDDSFRANLATLYGGEVLVVDTSGGGHPTGAYIRAFREFRAASYLFVQDSMAATERDCVAPFRGRGPVVAWCRFPLSFDPGQEGWVRGQYRDVADPEFGIFGPVFYATRAALERAERFFPAVPQSRLEAQGTERAWAFCFQAAGVPVAGLHDCDPRHHEGPLPPFTKTYAGRP